VANFPGRYQNAIFSGSTSTSNAWFVQDFRLLTVSIQSGATQAGAANVIIEGSNSDGLQQADLGGPTSSLGWSRLTLILPAALNSAGNAGRGIFTFDPPGYRWVRSAVSATEHSVSSCWTITFSGTRF